MQIVIAGAGSVGRSIARDMLARGHKVTITDKSPEAMKVSSVPDANWILGDVSTPEVMKRAGGAEADALIAATGDDQANLVIALLAKTEFGVPRVIARVNNPKNEWMFNESWGVDISVSTPRLMTALVEEALTVGALVPIFRLYNSRNALFSIVLSGTSPVLHHSVGDLTLPTGVMLSAIIHDGDPLPANPETTFSVGDQLLLLFADKGAETVDAVARLLIGEGKPEENGSSVPVDTDTTGSILLGKPGVEEPSVSPTQD